MSSVSRDKVSKNRLYRLNKRMNKLQNELALNERVSVLESKVQRLESIVSNCTSHNKPNTATEQQQR